MTRFVARADQEPPNTEHVARAIALAKENEELDFNNIPEILIKEFSITNEEARRAVRHATWQLTQEIVEEHLL